MTMSANEERYSAAFTAWCDEHDHDPYSPHAAAHFAALSEEAERLQQWMLAERADDWDYQDYRSSQ